jgi:hypothetical protein
MLDVGELVGSDRPGLKPVKQVGWQKKGLDEVGYERHHSLR